MGRICLRTTEATSWVPGLTAQQPPTASGPAHGPWLSMGLVAVVGGRGRWCRWKQVHIWRSTRQHPPPTHFVFLLLL